MRRVALLAAPLLMVGLVGCSQLSALAPVSGGPITTLRTAANDVLLEKGVEILVAPECTESDSTFTCAGTTIDMEPITVTSSDAEATTMTVTVGGTVLYDGDVKSVIDRFAEAPQ
ncbi:MAG: hypothetical protein QG661_531 [Actinomycetota bacterium]|nr:hypothetical protein [Actinomycetota bacterium]